MRKLDRLLAIFLVIAWASTAAAGPNFVLLLVDNVGYGDLGCYGNREIKTPRIDSLASEGVRCTDFYIGSPSCMPSRGALLTGRHPVRNGLNEQIYKIDEHQQVGLPRDEVLLPSLLKQAGYASGCFGKWNLGFAPGSRPTDRGFDEYFGSISGNCDYYTYVYNGRNDLFDGTEPARSQKYSTFEFADRACDFIRRNRDRPFFCYVPFSAAHFPNPRNKPRGAPAIWQAPRRFFEIYGDSDDTLDERKRYRAVVTALDEGIGRVIDQIESLDLTQNTIVALLSDNGAFMIPGRGLECASNRPLKGGGTTLWEGGIRVPCIVRWPRRLPAGGVCPEALWSMDLFSLGLFAAGIQPPADRVLDGRDPIPTLAGEASSPHEALCWSWGGSSRAIRKGSWKLLRERQSRAPNWQLFDLSTDIGETRDLSASQPRLAAELEARHASWMEEATRKATSPD